MSSSSKIKCIKCMQPDIPFVKFYIFYGHICIRVFYDPTELEANIINLKDAEKEISDFDLLMDGGKLDD